MLALTPLIQIAFVGIHTFALYYLRFPGWEFTGLLIFAATFVRADRVRLMAILNLIFIVGTGSLLMVAIQSVGAVSYSWPAPWVEAYGMGGLTNRAAIYAGFTALYAGLFSLFCRFKFLRYPVAITLTVVFLLVASLHVLGAGTFAYGVAAGLLFAFSKVFWPICYQLSETDFLRRIPFVYHLGTLSAPWQGGWVSNSIVRGYSDYSNFAVNDREKFFKTQIGGMRLIASAVVFEICARAIGDYFFSGVDPSPFSISIGYEFSTAGYLNRTLPIHYAWLFILIQAAYFLFSLTSFTHAAVSLARLCGFDILRNVYRPLEATSFNNFLSRIYYYYIAILQRFFFFPLWRALRGLPHRRTRTAATVLLTIFLGGMLTTVLHQLPFRLDDYDSIWSLMKTRIPYFGMLASLCAFSALTGEWPAWWDRPLPRHFRGLWFCFLYALCYSTQSRLPELDEFAAFRNLAYLFGF